MDIHVPFTPPHLLTTHNDTNCENQLWVTPSRKRNFQITTDTSPNPKRRRLYGKRGGGKQKAPTPCQTRVQTKPTVATNAKNKSGMDALVLSDVKPDIKPDIKMLGNDNVEESFATRVAKGSGWILIDEYSAPKSPGKAKPDPGANDAPTSDPTTIPSQTHHNKTGTKYKVGNKHPEPNNTMAITENIIDTTKCDEKSIIPNGVTRTVNDDDIEHRKQKHRVGINPDLLRWLWEDPTRLPKAREDMARWTQYLTAEMSNPAFQLFLAMVCNFKAP